MYSDTPICPYPFINIMLTANGIYKPCCRYRGELAHHEQVLRAPQHSLAEAWNCSDMVQLRKALLTGEKPEHCRDCWEEEASGIQSVRMQGLSYNIKYHPQETVEHPQRLDIYPGNICNLRCRICSAPLSSSLITEHQQIFGIKENIYNNLDQKNINIIYSWAPFLFEIGIFGGEPLLAQQTLAIIKHLVSTGESKHIRLMINTNCSVFDKKFAEQLSTFRKVFLNFSLDDIYERLEYQRKGLAWAKAQETISNYLRYGGTTLQDTVQLKICYTVSIFNIFYLPEYIELVKKTFNNIQIYFNLLHLPEYYCIYNLPPKAKKQITEKLQNYLTTTTYSQEPGNRTIADIINFMSQPAQIELNQLLSWISKLDSLRQESFAETFPEYWSILNG